MKKEEIIVYTNNKCSYCKYLKRELKNKNIDFQNKLTSDFKNEWLNVTTNILCRVETLQQWNN